MRLESVLGIDFPRAYKLLFDTYGDVEFDKFLGIFRPRDDVDEERLRSIRTVDDLRGYAPAEGGTIRLVDDHGSVRLIPPYPVYPDPGGLFPWGVTTNGDRLMWLTSSADPEQWPTVVTDDGYEWWQYNGSFIDLLVGLMEGTVTCPLIDCFESRHVNQLA